MFSDCAIADVTESNVVNSRLRCITSRSSCNLRVISLPMASNPDTEPALHQRCQAQLETLAFSGFRPKVEFHPIVVECRCIGLQKLVSLLLTLRSKNLQDVPANQFLPRSNREVDSPAASEN